jgi:hypothetical protein
MVLFQAPPPKAPPALHASHTAWKEVGTFIQRRDGAVLAKLTFFVDLQALQRHVGPWAKWDTSQREQRVMEGFMQYKIPLKAIQELLLDIGPKARRELSVGVLKRGNPELDLEHPVCQAFLNFWSKPFNVGAKLVLEFSGPSSIRISGPFGRWATDQDPGMGRAMMKAFFGDASIDPALKEGFFKALFRELNVSVPEPNPTR